MKKVLFCIVMLYAAGTLWGLEPDFLIPITEEFYGASRYNLCFIDSQTVLICFSKYKRITGGNNEYLGDYFYLLDVETGEMREAEKEFVLQFPENIVRRSNFDSFPPVNAAFIKYRLSEKFGDYGYGVYSTDSGWIDISEEEYWDIDHYYNKTHSLPYNATPYSANDYDGQNFRLACELSKKQQIKIAPDIIVNGPYTAVYYYSDGDTLSPLRIDKDYVGVFGRYTYSADRSTFVFDFSEGLPNERYEMKLADPYDDFYEEDEMHGPVFAVYHFDIKEEDKLEYFQDVRTFMDTYLMSPEEILAAQKKTEEETAGGEEAEALENKENSSEGEMTSDMPLRQKKESSLSLGLRKLIFWSAAGVIVALIIIIALRRGKKSS